MELFFEKCCYQSPEGMVTVDDVYEAYGNFCKDRGCTIDSREHLVKFLLSLPFKPLKCKGRPNGETNAVASIRWIELVN